MSQERDQTRMQLEKAGYAPEHIEALLHDNYDTTDTDTAADDVKVYNDDSGIHPERFHRNFQVWTAMKQRRWHNNRVVMESSRAPEYVEPGPRDTLADIERHHSAVYGERLETSDDTDTLQSKAVPPGYHERVQVDTNWKALAICLGVVAGIAIIAIISHRIREWGLDKFGDSGIEQPAPSDEPVQPVYQPYQANGHVPTVTYTQPTYIVDNRMQLDSEAARLYQQQEQAAIAAWFNEEGA